MAVLCGAWRRGEVLPPMQWPEELPDILELRVDASGVTHWDSRLCVFLLKLGEGGTERRLSFDPTSLPRELCELYQLATAVPEKTDARRPEAKGQFLEAVGHYTLSWHDLLITTLEFSGETVRAFCRLFTGAGRLRKNDFLAVLQSCGPEALGIVALISVLVGMIIAFLGSVVLTRFGAEHYVSYLVGYGMLRELGALMVAIIMAGRTGAAFAAEIATMKANEEIDALKVNGICPYEFLVLPRLLALVLMFPLLTVCGNILGLISGGVVSYLLMDVSSAQFIAGLTKAVGFGDLGLGLVKSGIFGILVGWSGCLRGMQAGNTAADVGLATTSAVVTGITANALVDWIANLL